MTKQELDHWCKAKLPSLMKKISTEYPKVKTSLDTLTSEFYIHALARINDIRDLSKYYYAYIYNHNFRFFSTNKDCLGHVSFEDFEGTQDFELSYEATQDPFAGDPEGDHLDKLSSIIDKLPLDDQILYQLYYVQDLTTRGIGKLHNLSHVGIHKQIKRMQRRIKKQLA